jgi:hypothetical protein
MARGSHELPKVSLGPTMPNRSTTYGRATPETALRPFQGWLTCGRFLPFWTPHVVRLCKNVHQNLNFKSSSQPVLNFCLPVFLLSQCVYGKGWSWTPGSITRARHARCLTPLCPEGRSLLKRPYCRFRGGLPVGHSAFNRFLPF